MESDWDFLNELDSILSHAELGLSNLSTVQTAISEDVVSVADGCNALLGAYMYLYELVDQMHQIVDDAFRRMGVKV